MYKTVDNYVKRNIHKINNDIRERQGADVAANAINDDRDDDLNVNMDPTSDVRIVHVDVNGPSAHSEHANEPASDPIIADKSTMTSQPAQQDASEQTVDHFLNKASANNDNNASADDDNLSELYPGQLRELDRKVHDAYCEKKRCLKAAQKAHDLLVALEQERHLYVRSHNYTNAANNSNPASASSVANNKRQ